MKNVFNKDEVRAVLEENFYKPTPGAKARTRSGVMAKAGRKKAAAEEHYSVICISMYNDDLARLDAKVTELKKAGHRKMTRSALIRFALDQVDAGKLPRSY